jgi:hypothetical protein
MMVRGREEGCEWKGERSDRPDTNRGNRILEKLALLVSARLSQAWQERERRHYFSEIQIIPHDLHRIFENIPNYFTKWRIILSSYIVINEVSSKS